MIVSEKMKSQNKHLIIPIIWQIVYVIFSINFTSMHRVYLDLIFYLGISVYFIVIGSINLKIMLIEWTSGKKFWLPVLYTLIAVIAAFGAGSLISLLLPNVDQGMAVLKVNNVQTLLAFAVTTMLLPPIAEEAFYRKGIIRFDSRASLVLSIAIGTLLYASEHSMKPMGILIAAIWSIPFTVSYVKTKNIYIPMTAHFLCNIIFNGLTVIFTAIKLLGI